MYSSIVFCILKFPISSAVLSRALVFINIILKTRSIQGLRIKYMICFGIDV
jgi:hypothetical protein